MIWIEKEEDMNMIRGTVYGSHRTIKEAFFEVLLDMLKEFHLERRLDGCRPTVRAKGCVNPDFRE